MPDAIDNPSEPGADEGESVQTTASQPTRPSDEGTPLLRRYPTIAELVSEMARASFTGSSDSAASGPLSRGE